MNESANGRRRSGMGRLCIWSLARAKRRWRALAAVLGALLLQVGLDVLKPWPMKVLIDHVIGDRPLSPAVALIAGALPGAGTPEGLLSWCVGATVLIFLCMWALGLCGSLANIAGIVNEGGNVMGMMPHPERASDPALRETDGAKVFRSAIGHLVASVHQGQMTHQTHGIQLTH